MGLRRLGLGQKEASKSPRMREKLGTQAKLGARFRPVLEALEARTLLSFDFALNAIHVGEGPKHILVHDMDGDHQQDIVLTYAATSPLVHQLTLLRGNGDGTFQAPIAIPLPRDLIPTSATAGDLNNDGKPDLAVGGSENGVGFVQLLFANGVGAFSEGPAYSFEPATISIAVFNAKNPDGTATLAIFNSDHQPQPYESMGTTSLTVGTGDGTNQRWELCFCRINLQTLYFEIYAYADFLGDGRQQLAGIAGGAVDIHGPGVGQPASNNGNTVQFLTNCRHGTPSDIVYFSIPNDRPQSFTPDALAIIDFAGTGQLGLAVTDVDSDLLAVLVPTTAATTTTITSSTKLATFGQPVTFNAVVTGPDAPPAGNVSFYDDGKWLGKAPLHVVDGVAQATLTTNSLGLGNRSIIAAYDGDFDHGRLSFSQAITRVTVDPTETTTKLTVTPNPIVFGGNFTITATVTGPDGIVPGDVTLMDGSTLIARGHLQRYGTDGIATATLNPYWLSVGTHTITAVYGREGQVTGRSEATVAVTVLPTFTAALSASTDNPNVGEAVTFTVRVTGALYGPQGTVTFMDGTTVLGTAPLATSGPIGEATFTTSGLEAGSHTITAVFVGPAWGRAIDNYFGDGCEPWIHPPEVAPPRAEASTQVNVVVPLWSIPFDARVVATGADAGAAPVVTVTDSTTGEVIASFTPFDPNFTGGVRVAVGNGNGDGTPDIICGAGPGGGPNIVVFNGKNGFPLYNFMAFNPLFTGGVTIAAGDVNGDGFADIICGADTGGGPNVSVFSGRDGSRLSSFFAYDPLFTGGVRVAAGNVMGTGGIDVIVGAGPGGGPHVTVFNADGTLLASFFAYDPNLTLGITVAAGENDGDGPVAIIAGTADTHVATFTFDVAAGTAGLVAADHDSAAEGARDGMIAHDSDDMQQLDAFFAADPVRIGSLFVGGTWGGAKLR